ncbi:MAG: galactose-1-phosphate uridylyltransferase [bacterium]|nr:galactose-1-phosphate uridylyltransferase [bacterium]
MPELRQDLISGDWVLVAPGRSKRPDQFIKKKPKRHPAPKSVCPFEDLRKSGNWPPIVAYPNVEHWEVVLLPNKFPALMHGPVCAVSFRDGIYKAKTGIGSHNLLITRDHHKNFAELNSKLAVKVLTMLQAWHREAAKDKCIAYTSSFFNWGPTAGASVWHPHYQILSLPIIPPHTAKSLHGAERYFKKHKRCGRCDVVKEEQKQKKRIVGENARAIAVVPYAAKHPFEVSILPKKHQANFWKTSPAEIRDVALLLQSVLRKMKKNLHDPDLNFFIHDVPTDHGQYDYHHWHVEVVPKISTEAGFELSTGIDINVVEPEMAAKILRE